MLPTNKPGPRAPRNRGFCYASGARPLDGYTIKRGIGRGGFGEVYFAVSDAGKEVALKLIRRNLDVELRGVTHCLNLKHPNLVALYDVRQDDQDNSWVVMEYVAGESLDEAIRRHPGGMPLDEALDWLRGIAAGVAYLHSHGIVHRDLKPGNVFRDEGLVKLGDYGLSKFISCSRRSGQTESIGTVHYMAPEIANGRYGKEIDIYALGIILYEMLTGRVPFEGESVGEVLMKHLTAEPDSSGLNEPLRSVVRRALAKDPAVRFNSVDDLLAALPAAAAKAAGGPGQFNYHAPLPEAATGASPAPLSGTGDEEPIWRYIREQAQRAVDYWKNGNLSTPAKIILILLVVLFSPVGFKLAIVGLLAYGGYRFGALGSANCGRRVWWAGCESWHAATAAGRQCRGRARKSGNAIGCCATDYLATGGPTPGTGRDGDPRQMPARATGRSVRVDAVLGGGFAGAFGGHGAIARAVGAAGAVCLAGAHQHAGRLGGAGAGQAVGRNQRRRSLATLCDAGGRLGFWRRGLRHRQWVVSQSAIRDAEFAPQSRHAEFLPCAGRLAGPAGIYGLFRFAAGAAALVAPSRSAAAHPAEPVDDRLHDVRGLGAESVLAVSAALGNHGGGHDVGRHSVGQSLDARSQSAARVLMSQVSIDPRA